MRGHVAAKKLGLPFAVGARLELLDGTRYLAWPTGRASYGRLTSLLSRGRIDAPKGTCALHRRDLLVHAEGMVLATLPPDELDETYAARLQEDAVALRDRLALPLNLAAWRIFAPGDHVRLHRLAESTHRASTAVDDQAAVGSAVALGVQFHGRS